MGRYTREVTYVTEFDGDSVTVVFTRMKRKEMLKLLPLLPEPDENGDVKMSMSENIKVMEEMSSILPNRIKSISGVTDVSGQPVPKDEILEEAYFLPLVEDIAGEILKESTVKGDQEKNSDATPPDGTEGSDAMIAEISRG